MANVARFSYTTIIDPSGERLVRPIVSVSLTSRKRFTADGLLDTGADANVLPYQLGVDLGANWDDAQPIPSLSGAFEAEARVIALEVILYPFDPARMVFVWVKTDTARLLLGQINFFQEFNVCFFGGDEYFEIQPKT